MYGYVETPIAPNCGAMLRHLLPFSGVPHVNEMHVTLMYDVRNIVTFPDLRGVTYCAQIKAVQVFGENTKHLVLELESESLQERHAELIRCGMKHSFTPYRPHLTIKKNPTTDDLDKLTLMLPELSDRLGGLRFVGENWQPIK